jgi:Cu+-exporting ATPase
LPDASADRPLRAEELSDLRHDAGTSHVSLEAEENAEVADMTRRFWVSVALAVPLLFLAMSEMIPGQLVQRAITTSLRTWIELALASPAVLWAGWPLFVRGWQSIVNRSPICSR